MTFLEIEVSLCDKLTGVSFWRSSGQLCNVSVTANRGPCVEHQQGTVKIERCVLETIPGMGLEHLCTPILSKLTSQASLVYIRPLQVEDGPDRSSVACANPGSESTSQLMVDETVIRVRHADFDCHKCETGLLGVASHLYVYTLYFQAIFYCAWCMSCLVQQVWTLPGAQILIFKKFSLNPCGGQSMMSIGCIHGSRYGSCWGIFWTSKSTTHIQAKQSQSLFITVSVSCRHASVSCQQQEPDSDRRASSVLLRMLFCGVGLARHESHRSW